MGDQTVTEVAAQCPRCDMWHRPSVTTLCDWLTRMTVIRTFRTLHDAARMEAIHQVIGNQYAGDRRRVWALRRHGGTERLVREVEKFMERMAGLSRPTRETP